jgi:hypothetical protein
MPPPELLDRPAPDSAGEVVLEHVRPDAPISRFVGPRAEEAYLRGQVDEARALGDEAKEREVSVALARLLASRGTDLGMATALAARALDIQDDAALRTELAGWYAGLGAPAKAAEVMRGLCDPARPAESARVLVKTAVLLARASDAAGAAATLREAAALDPGQAMASELLGTLAGWASEEVPPEAAAAAYLEAADRREAAQEKEPAFEDRLRAFEIAPHHEEAATTLASALTARGRTGAADEVMRAYAAAIAQLDDGGAAASQVHVRRMLSALLEGDSAVAVGAMLDIGLEAEVEGEIAADVDEVLSRAGLNDLLAVRLAMRAERQAGGARAETFQTLAELFDGPLSSPEEAVEAWIEALASDPTSSAARDALRAHGKAAKDYEPLVEALIRVGEGVDPSGGDRQDGQARVAALKELVTVAYNELRDPALSSWAQQKVAVAGKRADAGSEATRGRAARSQSIMMRAVDPDEDDAMAAAEALDSAKAPEERIAALRRLAKIYRGRPHVRAEYLDVLAELAQALPAERAFTVALERMTSRTGDLEPIERVMRAWLSEGAAPELTARARLWLSTIARRRGDEARALEEAAPLLDEAPEDRRAMSAILLTSTRVSSLERRADALVRLSGSVPAATRSVMLAVAAELYAAVGDAELALQAAELACEVDPTSARAASTRAALAAGSEDRAEVTAIERAISAVVPRGILCERLSRSLEALGDKQLSLSWTQRWVALLPGSPRAIADLVRRASDLRDVGRLAEALGWVLAQPKPLADMEEALGDALGVLFELDRARAIQLSRRALDAAGPHLPALRARLLRLADRASDPALAISVLERWVASYASPEEELELLLVLAKRRLDARDLDGAARELVRAAECGADPEILLERVEAVEAAARDRSATQSSDRLVSLAEARARALVALGPARLSEASDAWRKVGSLLWDLAADRRTADAAFFTASELLPDGGAALYAHDLCEFAGPDEAIAMLHARAGALQGEEERPARARLLIEAANVANANGLPEEALSAASTAIDIDPSRADAIVLIERSAHVEGGFAVLDHAYDRLADAALGCFGRRAAHYRAARQLEKRGAERLALRHAIACFEAVPGPGTSYALLARLAERSGDTLEAVRALQRVAEKAHPDTRAEWLKRAANLTGSSEEGARARYDILLSALNARPDREIVDLVGVAMRELIALTGDRDVAAMRFERAVRAVLRKLEGPDGARTAIALARVATTSLRTPRVAVAALERAMIVDGDIDEFASCVDLVDTLALDHDIARRLLESVQAAADKPYSSVGTALLRLASKLAWSLGEERASVALLVHAARRDSENDALVVEADEAVQELGDMELLTTFDKLIPTDRRVEALIRLAERLEREGVDAAAVSALERALTLGELLGDDRDRVVARLRHLLTLSGRTSDVEALLRAELRREDLSAPARLRLARDLGAILANRGDYRGALDALLPAAREAPIDHALIEEIRRLARRTGDRAKEAVALSELAELAPDDEVRLSLLRELVPIVRELGDHGGAAVYERAIAELSPVDPRALEALEQEANERSDHEAIAALLLRRIEIAPPEERRALRLRRAAVLEQRLGRRPDACAELEAALAESPDDTSALRFLADISERLGSPLRAAPLWRKLSDLAATTDERADYGLRAAGGFLSGGDPATAKEILEAIAPIAAREAILELRVQLARQEGDWSRLVQALDQLASASSEPAERRAEILLDAAAAASAAGDDAVAMDFARRAVKLAPLLPAAVLEARRLELKARGSGTPRDAQTAVDDLTRIQDRLSPQHVELHAFLLAEALDAVQGGGAGMRELSRRHAETGHAPLISLGMAERLVRNKSYKAALSLFENALTGDLHGLRSRGRVAIAGAEAAVNAGDLETAARLLGVAVAEPDTKPLAMRRQLELTAARGDPTVARTALEQLARQSTGVDRARALAQLARLLADPAEVARTYAEALPLAVKDRALHAQLTQDLARAQARLATSHQARSLTDRASSTSTTIDAQRAAFASSSLSATLTATTPPPPSAAPPSHWRGAAPQTAEEVGLFLELVGGSFDAGERLIELYSWDTDARSHEILSVRKHQATIRPGDRAALTRLREAAAVDGNQPYARAIEHILRAFESDTPPPPPPLSAQGEASDLVVPLLFGAGDSPLHEALAMVWETGLYRRDITQCGLSGVPRIQPGGGTIVSELYSAAARRLGLLRTGLFHQRGPGPLTAQVALLSPPAVFLSGDVQRETPDLAFLIGSSLAGATPPHALVSALPERALRTLISALLAAFGPVDGAPRGDPAIVRLGQNLWQLIPPRAARRLHEICADVRRITFDAAVDGTRRAMRRAGLFAAGDLAAAVRVTSAELSLTFDVPLSAPDGLARACAAHPPIADLVRLASSSEYADVRWQPASSQQDRRRADASSAPKSRAGT